MCFMRSSLTFLTLRLHPWRSHCCGFAGASSKCIGRECFGGVDVGECNVISTSDNFFTMNACLIDFWGLPAKGVGILRHILCRDAQGPSIRRPLSTSVLERKSVPADWFVHAGNSYKKFVSRARWTRLRPFDKAYLFEWNPRIIRLYLNALAKQDQ